MKHETAWGDRAGNPSSCQLEVAVMAVRFDIRSALRSDRPKLFRISRLRCVDTESKTVAYVSARDATTHGRMVGKTGITTRLHPLALAFPPPRCQE
jgi:hypothetical protein